MVAYLVWDWNGTLLNDVGTGAAIMNVMLERRGLPLLTEERYQEIFTFPVRDYYKAAGLDLQREPFADLAAEWTELYAQLSPACGLFPQSRETLQAVQQEGIRQLVVSASPQATLDRQVNSLGIREYLEAVLGLSDIYAGSKGGIAQRYFREKRVALDRVLFVGDTLHDWEVAQEAGCSCVLLAQGHQSRARLETAGVPVLESLSQVPVFLRTMQA